MTTTTDTIEIKLVRTNVFARWGCTVCGGYTEKVAVLAEGQDEHGTIRVCERCLESGDIDHLLEVHAAELVEQASLVRALVGRLKVPSYAEWCEEIDTPKLWTRRCAKAWAYKADRSLTHHQTTVK